jgi:mono/diheme cytochrome c family protein
MRRSLEIKAAVVIPYQRIIEPTWARLARNNSIGWKGRKSLGRRKVGNKPPDAATLAARGRTLFFQSCAHCHGQDADGGEDAPSLLKLQISGAPMALVIYRPGAYAH